MIDCSISSGLCILRLDAPPVNAITFSVLEELCASIHRANEDGAVRAVVLTGDENHFSAGADVNIFKEITTPEEAVRTSRVFQEGFAVVEGSEKPVAAALAGKVMGSALELAAACHFRVCGPGTLFSMPESRLGINPGAGGTQRLPRLIGPEAALRMMLTAETIDAHSARELGLVDAVCGTTQLLETAFDLVQSSDPVTKTRLRADKVQDAAANEVAFAKAEEMLAKGRPEIIAPREILEAVKTGLTESFDAGLAREQEAFARCMETPAAKNRIYIFFASRKTGKVPRLKDARPTEVNTAAVVGMGSMGAGIAQALISAGVPAVVRDKNESALEKGVARIERSIEKRVSRGKLTRERADATLELLSTATAPKDLADADLVIEAVYEDVAVKQSVLAEIEAVCRAETIIATNTSTLSLDLLAEAMTYPDRLIGMHFFNPAHSMPLVEVIRRNSTPLEAIATTLAFAKAIRKTPVLVENSVGFLVNRLFIPYLKESFHLLEDGAAPEAIDAAMVEFGFPMGPLALIDMSGLDILMLTDSVLRRAFPAHGPLSGIVRQLVDCGHLGQKTGSGVYKYDRGDYTPHHNEVAEGIITGVARDAGKARREVGADEIAERLILRMCNEAFYVLDEKIAQRESDIDAATVLGVGFPDFRGGVLKYARDLGIDTVAGRLEALAEQFGDRFKPPESLRDRKGIGS